MLNPTPEVLAALVAVKRAGTPLREVAKASGLSPGTLSRIERCKGDVTVDTLRKLAAWANVSFFVGKEAPTFYVSADREDALEGPQQAEAAFRILWERMNR